MGELYRFLGPKSNKDTEKILWCSDEPSTIGRQRGCDVISGPVSCLKPNIVINTEVDVWDLYWRRNANSCCGQDESPNSFNT